MGLAALMALALSVCADHNLTNSSCPGSQEVDWRDYALCPYCPECVQNHQIAALECELARGEELLQTVMAQVNQVQQWYETGDCGCAPTPTPTPPPSPAFTMASDARLKRDIVLVGMSLSTVPMYTFRYTNRWCAVSGCNPADTWVGTMAQDLIGMGREDAVVRMSNGYMAVDYSKLDVPIGVV